MKFRVAMVGALLALSGSVPALVAARAQASPPVLLITIDTLRQDTLSTYGGPAEAPAISALAERGVRFDNAVAHAVMTLPSHTSILTGLDPSRHGVHDNHGFRASDVLDTWAERLKAEGYDTGAFIGAFPLDSRFGLAQGFDVYDDFFGADGDNSYVMPERPASAVVTAARRWIRGKGDSWFAWVHVYDPHAPYLPPPPFDQQYRDPYVGEVAATDSALAPLLADAERMGALIIVTSDHGEARGDHGEQTHGVLAYNSTIRVPMVVAGPGVATGVVSTRRVGHADIMPTVLERLGLDRGAAQGSSFNDILDSGSDQGIGSQSIYFEALTPNLTRSWAPLRGIFRGDWKFIDLPLPELYDVTADPGEATEMSRSRGSMMVELNGVLQDHLEGALAVDAPLAEDPETTRRLRSLGYLGGSGGGAREYGPEDDPKNLIHLDAAVQAAVRELERGEFDAAAARLETVLAERPDFVSAILKLAQADVGRGEINAAITRMQTASREEWATTELRRGLGVYLLRAGRLDEAIATLKQVIEEDPNNIEAMNILATGYREAGRPAEAISQVEAALLLDPTYAELHVNHGELLLRADRTSEAQQALERALVYDPRLSSAHTMLGAIALQQGRKEEAFEHWRTAISYNPNDLEAMDNLAIELLRVNRFAESVEVYEKLFAAVPAQLAAEYQITQKRDMVARIKRDQGIR